MRGARWGAVAAAADAGAAARRELVHPPRACPPQVKVKALAEIVGALVQGVQRGEDVDLNEIKRQAALRHRLARAPKLVEIIAALPEEHKAALLPQ